MTSWRASTRACSWTKSRESWASPQSRKGRVEAFAYRERPGQFIEVDQLESAMADEVGWNPPPADLVAQLEADRDRFLSSLTAEQSRALVERLAAAGQAHESRRQQKGA